MTLSFEAFRATGVDVPDVCAFQEDGGSPQPGRVYMNGRYFIELGSDSWVLRIANTELASTSLDDLEHKLYDWMLTECPSLMAAPYRIPPLLARPTKEQALAWVDELAKRGLLFDLARHDPAILRNPRGGTRVFNRNESVALRLAVAVLKRSGGQHEAPVGWWPDVVAAAHHALTNGGGRGSSRKDAKIAAARTLPPASAMQAPAVAATADPDDAELLALLARYTDRRTRQAKKLADLLMVALSMLRDLNHDWPWKELACSYEDVVARAKALGLPVEELE